MSDALGLSVPHLNRMLAQLRSEGMIALNERRVEFIDMKAIAAARALSAGPPGADSTPQRRRIGLIGS